MFYKIKYIVLHSSVMFMKLLWIVHLLKTVYIKNCIHNCQERVFDYERRWDSWSTSIYLLIVYWFISAFKGRLFGYLSGPHDYKVTFVHHNIHQLVLRCYIRKSLLKKQEQTTWRLCKNMRVKCIQANFYKYLFISLLLFHLFIK